MAYQGHSNNRLINLFHLRSRRKSVSLSLKMTRISEYLPRALTRPKVTCLPVFIYILARAQLALDIRPPILTSLTKLEAGTGFADICCPHEKSKDFALRYTYWAFFCSPK